MKIGIFGGSFNPPHKMHLEMALELINKHYVDKIIYVPTGSQYKYKNNLIEDRYRFDMLSIISNKYKNISVSDFELKDNVVYTCETLAYFKKKYPKDDICFICGADNLSYMDQWKNGLYILKNYKILVIKRNTDVIDDILDRFFEYQENIIVTDICPRDISSTKIRKLLLDEKEDLSLYLDEEVIEYIRKNRLYKNRDS